LVHIDAHTDLYGPFFGSKIWHGNPFGAAVGENLIDCDKTVQIGLRGSGYGDDYDVARNLVSFS